jgi:peptidoglycan/xylan/chitin deacetylase (PgdA/CDA1 family)
MERRRGMTRLTTAATALAGSALLFIVTPVPRALTPIARATVAQTIVTIQFDDGVADQYQTLGILSAHGMHATFYVNSGFIGDADHMTWDQLTALFNAGNEIGGHTVFHTNVKKLKTLPAATRCATIGTRSTLTTCGPSRSRIRSGRSTPAPRPRSSSAGTTAAEVCPA